MVLQEQNNSLTCIIEESDIYLTEMMPIIKTMLDENIPTLIFDLINIKYIDATYFYVIYNYLYEKGNYITIDVINATQEIKNSIILLKESIPSFQINIK